MQGHLSGVPGQYFCTVRLGYCMRVQRFLSDRVPIFLFFFFFFLSSYFYPGGHPFGQAGWLSTTQVLKGSLLPESGRDEKEK